MTMYCMALILPSRILSPQQKNSQNMPRDSQ